MAADQENHDENQRPLGSPRADGNRDTSSPPEYEVGYGKPPKHTQFKPGHSGNPRGRPKGSRNFKTDLLEELGEKIEIREGDRPRKITKQRALVKSLTNGSIKGNPRSTGHLLAAIFRVLDTGANQPEIEEDLTAEEAEILRAFEELALDRAAAALRMHGKDSDERGEES